MGEGQRVAGGPALGKLLFLSLVFLQERRRETA